MAATVVAMTLFPLAFMSESHRTPFTVFDGSGNEPHPDAGQNRRRTRPRWGFESACPPPVAPSTVGRRGFTVDRETPVERTAQRLSRQAAGDLVTLTFASWNLIRTLLQRIDALSRAA